MHNRNAIFLAYILFASIFLIFLVSASESKKMTVEANILAQKEEPPIVSIEIPDYIFFGDISVGNKSEEIKVYVNNTGNTNISITPQLENPSEEVFNNLYFRLRKSGEFSRFSRIGEFRFNIQKPKSTFEDEYFYIKLDLTNFNGNIDNDLIGHKAGVIFTAMPD